jgi:hypothetical protein
MLAHASKSSCRHKKTIQKRHYTDPITDISSVIVDNRLI